MHQRPFIYINIRQNSHGCREYREYISGHHVQNRYEHLDVEARGIERGCNVSCDRQAEENGEKFAKIPNRLKHSLQEASYVPPCISLIPGWNKGCRCNDCSPKALQSNLKTVRNICSQPQRRTRLQSAVVTLCTSTRIVEP